MATQFEKDWFTKANVVLENTSMAARTGSHLYEIKRLLTGESGASRGLWTVIGSSDGIQFGMDEVDRWTERGDVRAPPNSNGARSWCVLRGPGDAPYYCVLHCDYVGLSGYAGTVRIRVTRSLPEGGSLTAPPSSPDAIVDTGTNTESAVGDSDLSAPLVLAYGIADDGAFFWFVRRRGVGVFFSGFIFSVLTESRSLDFVPAVAWYDYAYTSPYGQRVLSELNGIQPGRGWVSFGARARRSDNDAGVTARLFALSDSSSSAGNFGRIMEFISSDDGDEGEAKPDWHIYVVTGSGSRRSLRGRLQDIRWAPNLPHGTVEPDTTTPASMAIGFMWFPMSETPDMS